MASHTGRLLQQALAVLDVALRVPCIFIIDAICNCNSDPADCWTGTAGQLLLRVTGIVVCSVVLVLSQKSLFKFYSLFVGMLLGSTAVLLNYYVTSHMDTYRAMSSFGLLPPTRLALWLAMAALQLLLASGYVLLLGVKSPYSTLMMLDVLVPVSGLFMELPVDVRRTLALISGSVLCLNTAVCLLVRFKRLYYSCRYVYLLVRHMYRIYGLQLLLEDTWKRIRVPDVLRVFWLTRLAAQAVVLVYAVRMAQVEENGQSYVTWDVFWELCSSLIISGCDSTLTVLGMSAVISSAAHYLGLGVLAFIGSTEDEEDRRLGFVAPVLFFILALQTGLSSLEPGQRLVRLSRNLCLLLTAVLHFVHGMTEPVLMALSASHVQSVRRHAPALLVSLVLLTLPVVLSDMLWRRCVLNTWLFAVTAFCVELCLKVLVSITVYALFMVDGYYGTLWEKLDDYVYYVRSAGNVVEFIFGIVMFGNGAYTMVFEAGSKIRACMMCLHAYFNIYLQAKSGWRTFVKRRAAVHRIQSLPEVTGTELRGVEDVCAICYQEFVTAARVTPCHHYFHALCLRKWLYIQDTCPMCHQKVYVEDDSHQRAPVSNNNGQAPAADEQARFEAAQGGGTEARQAAGAEAEPDDELLEDNDSIEYDEDEWGAQNAANPVEEDYINDDTDSNTD
ncbi:E3 ubiquitin-protein ligase RNF139 [Tachysurus vachellii]|uniref:E3 ubiquitin-protein ligase RNF139 n=1 Tax=Tachysurus vachellii TaxID=175792 RepID=UPI00296B45D1|nr:E3 ubiquitin-protein ligase RNF139 [Tachysurus vachellii]